MDRFWLNTYPAGVPADIDVTRYRSLPELLDESFRMYAQRDAFVFMDHALTYAELDRYSAAFGAWLQAAGLPRGARVAMHPVIVDVGGAPAVATAERLEDLVIPHCAALARS